MQAISELLAPLLPAGFHVYDFVQFVIIVLIGTLVLGFIGRIACGKRSSLNHAVSSAIGILFMYAASIVAHSYGSALSGILAPLPFIALQGSTLTLFTFSGAGVPEISYQLLSMVILAFLMNLIDGWLPKGKKLFGWLFRSILTVILAFCVHGIVTYLIGLFLPEVLLSWAPVVLLGILCFMLLLGVLKIVLGLVLATVNPIIAGLYAFFFSHRIGKMLSRAVLTTVILSALVLVLEHVGLTAISISSAVLAAYIPLLILLLVLWYILSHLL